MCPKYCIGYICVKDTWYFSESQILNTPFSHQIWQLYLHDFHIVVSWPVNATTSH